MPRQRTESLEIGLGCAYLGRQSRPLPATIRDARPLSGSKKLVLPGPSQVGQEPIGLLNETRRGSNSGRLYEHTGQAKTRGKANVLRRFPFPSPARARCRGAVRFSKLSASRCLMSAFTFTRSMTTSILCLMFFQLRHFVELINFAVHAHTGKALRLQVGKEVDKLALTLFDSPLRIITRVSSGSFKTASTI